MKNMGRLLAPIVAVVAVALPVTAANAANARNPRNAESVYTHTEIQRCYLSLGENCADIFTNATYSGTQIWVNGNVRCSVGPTQGTTTWCGVGGGNGTATLDVGMNWTDPTIGNLYQRVNIPANGNTGINGNWPATNNGKGCSSNGTNNGIIFTEYFVCNNLGAGSPQ